MFSAKNLTVVEFEKDIELNLEKSYGSYAYNDINHRAYLDFFQFFSSNPLGYNHEVFQSKDFGSDMIKYGQVKISSGRVYFKYFSDFIEEFHSFASRGVFTKYYFIHGGALAIENALKIAFDLKRSKSQASAENLQVMSFKGAFHGVSGYTIGLSDLPAVKVDNLPKFPWPKFPAPQYFGTTVSERELEEDSVLEKMNEYVRKEGSHNIAALILEPVQCSSGDNRFSSRFLRMLRDFCTKNEICFIFDEVQTGFGVTGTLWYFEQLDVVPDILVFGKKAQVCGLATTEQVSNSFAMLQPCRLSVTWDGHICDIVRAKHLMGYLKSTSFLDNVKVQSKKIVEGLSQFNELLNVRATGLLIAFDFATGEARDTFVKNTYKNGLLVNIAAQKTIRLRPPLNVSAAEVADFFDKVRKSLRDVA